jgi:hypothetical protein
VAIPKHLALTQRQAKAFARAKCLGYNRLSDKL